MLFNSSADSSSFCNVNFHMKEYQILNELNIYNINIMNLKCIPLMLHIVLIVVISYYI